eukprot:GHVH01003864.1.p1 GENE.GHVH01003864.1~~GHVH01003864.1.p1  ORF type:complete len:233 (-),score=21.22 GHVH01003864.1:60-758(-)
MFSLFDVPPHAPGSSSQNDLHLNQVSDYFFDKASGFTRFYAETCQWTKGIVNDHYLPMVTAIVCDEVLRFISFGTSTLCEDFTKASYKNTMNGIANAVMVYISVCGSMFLTIWVYLVPIMPLYTFTLLFKVTSLVTNVIVLVLKIKQTRTMMPVEYQHQKIAYVYEISDPNIFRLSVVIFAQIFLFGFLIKSTRLSRSWVDHPSYAEGVVVIDRGELIDEELGGPWQRMRTT